MHFMNAHVKFFASPHRCSAIAAVVHRHPGDACIRIDP
ncbi:hypothetical protein B1M_21463 [Burkholderia sp. TJI49]|nr:hypothetical protein B1M_21463 [Burkholderia sp. TJI49]